MATPTVRCPICSSEELSPETDYARFEHHARFRYMGEMGTFRRKDLKLGPDRVRFCLSCGYLMLFANEEDVRQLRKGLAEGRG